MFCRAAIRLLIQSQYCHQCRPPRRFHDFVRGALPTGGMVRVPLTSAKVVGVAVSRGVRSYQEDAHRVCCVTLDPEELQETLRQWHNFHWDPDKAGHDLARQVVFIGIYDGHGGPAISARLSQSLHTYLESVDKSQVPGVYEWIKSVGGYFKRYRGGALTKWIVHDAIEMASTPLLNLEARVTLAFLQADREISEMKESSKQGSTASVALFQSLDMPAKAFFSADTIVMTVAHCGDTRVLLCSTDGGQVFPMTESHHAESRGEAARLRRLGGTGLITDSFGEARWMGALENTRGLGDKKFKRFGVTPEPEVRSKLLKGSEWAYSVSVSDGITSVLSDDEIVDIARHALDPQQAANAIISFAEELGSEDNATAIVVPLAGWGQITGPDKTKELRDYRRNQAIGSERQRRM